MRVVLADVPSSRAGAREVRRALEAVGHAVEQVRLPFRADGDRLGQAMGIRLLALWEVDAVVALGYPACALRHERLVVWRVGGAVGPAEEAAERAMAGEAWAVVEETGPGGLEAVVRAVEGAGAERPGGNVPAGDGGNPAASAGAPAGGAGRAGAGVPELHYGAGAVPSADAVARGGVVVLHRLDLHETIAARWADEPLRYVERMHAWYGTDGAIAAEREVRGGAPADPKRFPLWEEALVGAEAVVTLREPDARRVAARWTGPTALADGAAGIAAAVAAVAPAVAARAPLCALRRRLTGELIALGIDPRLPVVGRLGADLDRWGACLP